MAYYNEDDDQGQGQGAPVQDPNAPDAVTTGGPSGSIAGQGSGNPAAAATSQASGAPGTPGQFVGIKQYLDANKPQSAKLARDVSGYVGGLGDQARSQLDTGVQGFNQAVDQNTIALDQGLLDEAKTDATRVAQDQQKLEAFKKQRDAQYQGPNSFQESSYFQPVNQAVSKATQASADTATAQGQKELISQVQNAKRGKVNQGALSFDAALLQADPTAKGVLAQTRKELEDIPQNLTKAQEASLAKAGQAAQTTGATKAAIQGVFSGEQGVQAQLEQQLKNKAQEAMGQSKSQAEQTMNLLKSGAEPNDSQLGLLGINRDQWKELVGDRTYLQNEYGVNPYSDLSVYGTVKNPNTQISAQNIASADDYAKYAALNQLMGTQNTFLTDPSLAGTADLDALDFNFGGAQGDIKNSIQLQAQARAQREAEQRAAEERARQEREAAEKKRLLEGGAIGGLLGGSLGTQIGAVFCFMGNTPIMMANGTYTMVQDLKLGDHVAYGGMVMAHGVSLCLDITEYKGRWTSENHAIFDGKRYVRAAKIKGGKNKALDIPVMVYPVVVQNHILISDNGVVYTDLMEVDQPGISDEEKLSLLNTKKHIENAQQIEKEIAWTLSSSEPRTMLN